MAIERKEKQGSKGCGEIVHAFRVGRIDPDRMTAVLDDQVAREKKRPENLPPPQHAVTEGDSWTSPQPTRGLDSRSSSLDRAPSNVRSDSLASPHRRIASDRS